MIKKFHFSLVHKITLLLVFAILLIQLIQIFSFEFFLKKNYIDRASSTMENSLNSIQSDITFRYSNLRKNVNFINSNNLVLGQIDFINIYQDIKSYNWTLIDAEKEKLLIELLYIVKLSLNDNIIIFDKDRELIAYIYRKDDIYKMSFISYKNGKRVIFSKYENENEYKRDDNILSFQKYKKTHTEEEILYHISNSNLMLTAYKTIVDGNKPIGYVKLSNIYKAEYFDKVSKQNNIEIITQVKSQKSKDSTSLFKNSSKINVHKDSNSLYIKRVIETYRGEFEITLTLDTSTLDKRINQSRLIFIIIAIFSIIFIVSLAFVILKRVFINPIDMLMHQIKKIEEKDYTQSEIINTHDELETIATNINILSKTINKRELEINYINKNLETTIEQEVEKNRQQQLLMLHQSRLAQMGEIISMIAHQWRQPLNILSLLTQGLVFKYKLGKITLEKMEKFDKDASKQIQGMSQTINEFSNFFKPEKEKINFCINDIISSTIDMLNPTLIDKSIDISFEYDDTYYTYGFVHELGQALINIINNAKDILIEKDIKNRYISIYLKDKDDNIYIYIKDNAGGIPDDIIDKIFDPYFSTKDEKNGTGLGLYMSKLIIEDHLEGEINVSNKDNGAEFEIILEKGKNDDK